MAPTSQQSTPTVLRWVTRLPWWAWALVLASLLGLAWAVVYGAGGTRTAWPHAFYFAIVLAVLPFGVRGGVVVALLATVLCGPLMPLDTDAGVPQELANWLTRGTFFVGVGLVAGLTVTSLRRMVEQQLVVHLGQELDAPPEPVTPTPGGQVARAVREVITEGRFHPVYQPIYALGDGRLVGVEALTRFDGAVDLPPDEWFAYAARLGMGSELDLAAIEAALDGSRDLPDGVALHVNVTPPTLRDPRLLGLLDAHAGRRLVVEITEHAVIEDYERLSAIRHALRARGVRLAVDDAGAGFASLRHICRLEPEIIKLDISLTRDLRHDPVRHALAEALVQFARRTGTYLVAEGIEGGGDLATWRRLKADAAQGYLLGRPGPIADLGLQAPPTGPASRLFEMN